MADTYSIDGHKLMYHPERVTRWLKGNSSWETAKRIYPIYVEITTIGACNHRCVFCSVDYLGYKAISQNEEVLKKRLSEMASLGVRSVMFAGEGEPMLWRPLARTLGHCGTIGLDTSLTTNMVPLLASDAQAYAKNCAWIKVSINAGTPKTYAKIHSTKEADFAKALKNCALTVKVRNKNDYRCTLGGQMLLLPDNVNEAVILAKRLRDIGMDYLVIKPYTQSLYGISRRYKGMRYADYLWLEPELKKIETKAFKVVFRKNAMLKYDEPGRKYGECNAVPFFWAYIMADGSLYSCSAFLGNKKFYLGNINKDSFKKIWEGRKRRDCMRFVRDNLDLSLCRKNCRMDEVNQYLWKLKNPDTHVNFI